MMCRDDGKYNEIAKIEKRLLNLVNYNFDDSMCKLYESGDTKDLLNVLNTMEDIINEFKRIINK